MWIHFQEYLIGSFIDNSCKLLISHLTSFIYQLSHSILAMFSLVSWHFFFLLLFLILDMSSLAGPNRTLSCKYKILTYPLWSICHQVTWWEFWVQLLSFKLLRSWSSAHFPLEDNSCWWGCKSFCMVYWSHCFRIAAYISWRILWTAWGTTAFNIILSVFFRNANLCRDELLSFVVNASIFATI